MQIIYDEGNTQTLAYCNVANVRFKKQQHDAGDSFMVHLSNIPIIYVNGCCERVFIM